MVQVPRSRPPPAQHRSDGPSISESDTDRTPSVASPGEGQDDHPSEVGPDASASFPSSSVHPDEITGGFHPDFPPSPVDPDVVEVHQTFRHSFWRLRRSRVADALLRQGARTDTLRRFGRCGESAWVLRDPADHDRVRLATNRCRHHWCEACQRDRRRVVTANLRTALEGRTVRLLTLTLAARPEPLADQLKRLVDSFRLFRRRPDVRRRVDGGVYFLEVTFNEHTERWHPHLHVLFEGEYLPQPVAKMTWLDVTGDSYIVDLRPINGPDGAASYVAKYATKAVSATVWTSPRRLDEAMKALTFHRTFQTFGTWKCFNLSKVPEDGTLWVPICTLATLIDRAKHGDDDAQRTLYGLTNRFDMDPIDLPEPTGDTS